jgi:hypothetical protein
MTHPIGMRLCSACRGDYEDPDAMATEDESVTPPEDEENGES